MGLKMNSHFPLIKTHIHHFLRIIFASFKPLISSGFPSPESALIQIRKEIALDVKQEKKISEGKPVMQFPDIFLKGRFMFRVNMKYTADQDKER